MSAGTIAGETPPWSDSVGLVLRESLASFEQAGAFPALHRDIGAKLICSTRISRRPETVFAFLENRAGLVVVTVRLQFWGDERYPVYATHSSDGDQVGPPLGVAGGRIGWPGGLDGSRWGRAMTEAADRQWTRLLGRLIPRVARHRDYWFRALESECGALAVALVNAHGVAPQLAVTPPSGFDGDGLTAGRVLLALAGLGGAVAELVSVSAEEAYIAETVSGAIRGELRRAFAGNAVVPWRSNGGQTTRKEVKDPDPKT